MPSATNAIASQWPFPADGAAEKLAKLQEDKAIIKRILGNKMRHEVRVIPDIVFFIDDTYEEVKQMSSLIASLNIPKEDKEESK